MCCSAWLAGSGSAECPLVGASACFEGLGTSTVSHPGAPGAPGAPSSGPRVVDVVPTVDVLVVLELTAVLVVVDSCVVLVVSGTVVSAVVGTNRAGGVVVVALRGTVATVLEVWGASADVEVVLTLVVVLLLVVMLVLLGLVLVGFRPGRVVVVTPAWLATGTCRDGPPRVTSSRRTPENSRANPYSRAFTR